MGNSTREGLRERIERNGIGSLSEAEFQSLLTPDGRERRQRNLAFWAADTAEKWEQYKRKHNIGGPAPVRPRGA